MHAFFEGKKAGEAYARKSGSWNVEVGSPTISLPFLRLHLSLIIQLVRTVPRRAREGARSRWQRPCDFPILPLGIIGGSAGHDATTGMTGLTRTTRHEPGRYESTTGMRVSQRGACHTETERRHGDAVRVAEPPYPRLHPRLPLPPDVCRHARDAPRGGCQDPRGDHRQCPASPPAR